MAQRTALAVITVLVLLTGVTQAQWVHRQTPGIPRLANGQPNLSAPAPKAPDGRPDLSGIWQTTTGKWLFSWRYGTVASGRVNRV